MFLYVENLESSYLMAVASPCLAYITWLSCRKVNHFKPNIDLHLISYQNINLKTSAGHENKITNQQLQGTTVYGQWYCLLLCAGLVLT